MLYENQRTIPSHPIPKSEFDQNSAENGYHEGGPHWLFPGPQLLSTDGVQLLSLLPFVGCAGHALQPLDLVIVEKVFGYEDRDEV